MTPEIEARIAEATGARLVRARPLSGGCVGDVFGVDLAGGGRAVAKLGDLTGARAGGLAREGFMLRYLAARSDLPVPEVWLAEDDLLVMQYLPTGGALDAGAERHAADLVAALHEVTDATFGFDGATLIGGLAQPNPRGDEWLAFFRDHRLRDMAMRAHAAGRLPASTLARIETLAGKLAQWIDPPERPSLIHGDMWGGNVLCHGGRISGFIDPAIYYADAEIELAFSTLFNTFGDSFFARYAEHRPIRPGFFEVRRDLYNLYPLLVHVRLFGGSYVGAVERTLARFGC